MKEIDGTADDLASTVTRIKPIWKDLGWIYHDKATYIPQAFFSYVGYQSVLNWLQSPANKEKSQAINHLFQGYLLKDTEVFLNLA